MAKRSANGSPREKSVAQPMEGGTLRVKLPEPVFPPVEKTSQAFKPPMPLARNLPLAGPPPKVVTPAASKEQTPPSRIKPSMSSPQAKGSLQPETLGQEKRPIEEPSQTHQESQARYIYIYVYVYVVESKLGPRFVFLSQNFVQGCVKTWSKIFLLVFPQFYSVLGYLKNHK